MTMKECFIDTINWLTKHERNRIIIKVKSDKELKAYQKFFKENIEKNKSLDSGLYDIIEWRVDTTLDK